MLPPSVFPANILRAGWAKPLAVACALVACEPYGIVPPGNCGDVPACSAIDYDIVFTQSGQDLEPDPVTGAVLIESLGFWINIIPEHLVAPIACNGTGRRGLAYATSCLMCSGPNLEIDSLYFTTDILPPVSDTLKAGHNFADKPLPPGFEGGGPHLLVHSGYPTLFRDSLFEVRFTGSADGVPKSGAALLHIRNPALLFP